MMGMRSPKGSDGRGLQTKEDDYVTHQQKRLGDQKPIRALQIAFPGLPLGRDSQARFARTSLSTLGPESYSVRADCARSSALEPMPSCACGSVFFSGLGCSCNPGLRRERGVQTEGKIDGGRRQSRASGDRLFFLKCAEGLAPKPIAIKNPLVAFDQRRIAEWKDQNL